MDLTIASRCQGPTTTDYVLLRVGGEHARELRLDRRQALRQPGGPDSGQLTIHVSIVSLNSKVTVFCELALLYFSLHLGPSLWCNNTTQATYLKIRESL